MQQFLDSVPDENLNYIIINDHDYFVGNKTRRQILLTLFNVEFDLSVCIGTTAKPDVKRIEVNGEPVWRVDLTNTFISFSPLKMNELLSFCRNQTYYYTGKFHHESEYPNLAAYLKTGDIKPNIYYHKTLGFKYIRFNLYTNELSRLTEDVKNLSCFAHREFNLCLLEFPCCIDFQISSPDKKPAVHYAGIMASDTLRYFIYKLTNVYEWYYDATLACINPLIYEKNKTDEYINYINQYNLRVAQMLQMLAGQTFYSFGDRVYHESEQPAIQKLIAAVDLDKLDKYVKSKFKIFDINIINFQLVLLNNPVLIDTIITWHKPTPMPESDNQKTDTDDKDMQALNLLQAIRKNKAQIKRDKDALIKLMEDY